MPLDQSPDISSSALPESSRYSYVIRLWFEATAAEAGHAQWRGHITNVASGERRFFEDLDEIADFIAPTLEHFGARIRYGLRVRRWIRRIRKRFRAAL
jgi:hypothetical protein